MVENPLTSWLYWYDTTLTLAFCIFLYLFLRQKEKNYGLLMIIILNTAYCLSGLSELIRPFIRDVVIVWDLAARVNYDFAMFWVAAFAYFTHRVLNSRTYFNFKLYMASSFVMCFMASAIYPLAVTLNFQDIPFSYSSTGAVELDFSKDPTVKQRILFFVLDTIWTTVTPILVSCYFYYRVYQALKKQKAIAFFQNQSIRGYWFFIVPLVCFLPGLLENIFLTFCDINNSTISLISCLMYRCWGVMILLGFRFLKPVNNDHLLEEEKQQEEYKPLPIKVSMVRLAPTKSIHIKRPDSYYSDML